MGTGFRNYATIYTSVHPKRALELFKHMYNIRTVSTTFIWDNVYSYNITFRRLMERYPTRNWGVIYQQGWTILLRKKLQTQNNNHFLQMGPKRKSGGGGSKRDQVCWKFNKGKSPRGSKCRFDHKCSNCCCVVVVYYCSYINKTKIFSGMCNGISISTHTQLKVEYWISDSHRCS